MMQIIKNRCRRSVFYSFVNGDHAAYDATPYRYLLRTTACYRTLTTIMGPYSVTVFSARAWRYTLGRTTGDAATSAA